MTSLELDLEYEDGYTEKVHRIILLKMLCYGQNHLIEHLKNQNDKYRQ